MEALRIGYPALPLNSKVCTGSQHQCQLPFGHKWLEVARQQLNRLFGQDLGIFDNQQRPPPGFRLKTQVLGNLTKAPRDSLLGLRRDRWQGFGDLLQKALSTSQQIGLYQDWREPVLITRHQLLNQSGLASALLSKHQDHQVAEMAQVLQGLELFQAPAAGKEKLLAGKGITLKTELSIPLGCLFVHRTALSGVPMTLGVRCLSRCRRVSSSFSASNSAVTMASPSCFRSTKRSWPSSTFLSIAISRRKSAGDIFAGGVTGKLQARTSPAIRSTACWSIQPRRRESSAAITIPVATASPWSHSV